MNVMHLISNAALAVQIVVVVLLFASVWSWALFLRKWFRLRSLVRGDGRFLAKYKGHTTPLGDLYNEARKDAHPGPLQAVFIKAMHELERLARKRQKPSLYRLEQVMESTLDVQLAQLRQGVPHLATLGNTAPFVGLFGTVWGIMRSFMALAKFDQITLSTVGPGVAEALFATAMGLVVAIPAVVFYNFLTVKIRNVEESGEALIQDFLQIALLKGGKDAIESLDAEEGKGH